MEALEEGVPKIRGTFLGGSNNKDCSIWGSILGSPYFGKLPSGSVSFPRRGPGDPRGNAVRRVPAQGLSALWAWAFRV